MHGETVKFVRSSKSYFHSLTGLFRQSEEIFFGVKTPEIFITLPKSLIPGEGKEGKQEKSYTFLLCRTGKDKEYTICCLRLLDPKLDKYTAVRASESWRHLRQGND
jgi:hypothetical protein